MKCKLCSAESDLGRFPALAAGWRLLETYGPQGNKYAALCPNETVANSMAAMKEMLENVSGKKK